MKVFCTNGLKSVLVELVPTFERTGASKPTVRPTITWGATANLAKELEGGAIADLAVLTAEAIDELIKRGKIAGGRIDLARSGIGVAVRRGAKKPDIGSPDALKRALLAANSVAHSKSGASGIYFPTVLARLGIAEAMQQKIVLPDAGTAVGEVVARGDAELGIQQISELLPVAGVEVVGPLPAELQKVTIFAAGVLVAAREPDAAKAFLTFVAEHSRPLLKSKGLEPV
jgi:molybdate transport system substrate-binding protein